MCGYTVVKNFVCKTESPQPPGPKGWPIVGVVFEVDISKLHLKLYEWAQMYGDIFQFHLLGEKFVVINSIDILRDLFLKEPNATITADRPLTFTGKYAFDDYADVGFSSPSVLCTKRRKLAFQLLHTYGKGLTCLESQILKNLQTFKDDIRSLSGKNIFPVDFVDDFIFNTVEVLIIGRSLGKEGPLRNLLIKQNDLLNEVANPGTDSIYIVFPFLRFLPLPGSLALRELKKSQSCLLDLLDTLSKEECEEKGIYHTMKEIMEEEDKSGKPWFTEVNLAALLLNLDTASFLTTRGTLLSVVHILAKRPELQKTLQKEVDDVIGTDREPRLSDRENCPTLEAVILETLRYISHLPVFLFHSSSDSLTIGDYTIDKKTVIIPNGWTIHHSEKYWEDPFTFRHERFLDSEGQLLAATHPIRKSMLEYLLFVLILILCGVIVIRSSIKNTDGQPPGPNGWPLVGIVFDVEIPKLHLKLYEWTQKYGDVFQFKILNKNFLCINSERIRNIDEENVDPVDMVDEFIFNSIEVLLIGRSFGKEGHLQQLLKKQNNLANQLAIPGIDSLYGIFPFLRFLPLPMSLAIRELQRTQQCILDLLEKLSKEECKEKGMYHTMKEVMKEEDENGERWFTKENLEALILNLVAASYLTTRGTLLSMLHILAKRPDLQQALQNEVDIVIGFDREPRLADREKCPMIEAVVLETLRYISHLPLLLPHSCSQSTTIGGYNIQKNNVIFANSWTLHHSERYWKEPFCFVPERFLDSDGQLLPAFHPVRKRLAVFGFGKRSCIGEVFAKSRIFLFLSTLLQTTTIAEPKDKALLDFDPKQMITGLVLQPKSFEVRFLLRSKSNVSS
ncbi:cytochrome P450 1A2-like [Saccostrea echinata]|uniref:cytochrome P450 1A2-like n=1 Tax=Saccostrea echinata TaxID=191078 RepID=UPI002A7EAECF|nr:cytochrome P450 1A2-like [Saccostrea echinata]